MSARRHNLLRPVRHAVAVAAVLGWALSTVVASASPAIPTRSAAGPPLAIPATAPLVAAAQKQPAAKQPAPAYPPTRPLQPAPVPTVGRPGYLVSYLDPTYGTQVTRVSDQTAMGVDLPASPWIRNAYAKRQVWNADGTLLLLDMQSPMVLLDGHTYRFLRTVDIPLGSVWSPTDAHI